jgi:uncharacterized protein YbjQ (UPF0145 family)
MLIVTTPGVEGARVVRYHGVVTGETIMGANLFRDFFASIRDIVGGRSGSYEAVLRDGRESATRDMVAAAQAMGANAIIGVDIDYASLGRGGSMLMVTVTGTAVTLAQD